MEVINKVIAPLVLAVFALMFIFRSEMVGSFLGKFYRRLPQDKSMLTDEQFTIRPAFIVLLGCLMLLVSLSGLFRYFSS